MSEWEDPLADLPDTPLERAMTLRNGLVNHAAGGSMANSVYALLRREFMADVATVKLLPQFVRTCRDTSDFWSYIKDFAGQWEPRRQHVRQAFLPLLDYLEKGAPPADASIGDVLASFDEAGVHAVWAKALERRTNDPEGAITAARTLLETVCKHVLDEIGGPSPYGPGDDLPKLYQAVAKHLNIAPSQHAEGVFKQILGGCSGVVEGLGAMRNRISDAHGQGKRPVKPAPRHAALAFNLAGAMATFIVETYQAR